MVGDNDTRCPLQQVLNYAQRLRELGKPFELDRFDAGHGALVVNERIRQMEALLRSRRGMCPAAPSRRHSAVLIMWGLAPSACAMVGVLAQ